MLGCVAAAATVAVEELLLGGSGGVVLENKIGSVPGRYVDSLAVPCFWRVFYSRGRGRGYG